MKCDLTKKQSIAAKRTLKSLLKALAELMEIQPIEKISVMDLCERAMIPRATFYNYFEDKYDLLHYFWHQLETEISPSFKETSDENLDMNAMTSNMIKNFAKNMSKWKKISSANIHDILLPDLFNYLKKQALNKFASSPKDMMKSSLPPELLASFYACAVIALGEWWVENKDQYDPNEAQGYFNELINWEKLLNLGIS